MFCKTSSPRASLLVNQELVVGKVIETRLSCSFSLSLAALSRCATRRYGHPLKHHEQAMPRLVVRAGETTCP